MPGYTREKCNRDALNIGYVIYIPKTTVNTTNVNKIKNSRLFKSLILISMSSENDPANTILLYINIVYAAEKTIEELAKPPNRGSLSNVPYKDKNSPTKFSVSGVPALPKHNKKNKIANIGVNWAVPLYIVINLVWHLSYNTPPAQINNPLETKPWG